MSAALLLYWVSLSGALLSLVGLAAAVRWRDRWLGVVAVGAMVAFVGAALLFGRAVF